MLKLDPTKTTPLVMALDGGTGSARAILFDLQGNEVAVGQREWVHHATPDAPGGMDFDTDRNGALFDETISEVIADISGAAHRIKAISATSMREGMVLYDGNDQAIWACPNIDGRAKTQAQELVDMGLADRIFETGGDWVSITAPARFLWIKQNRPDIFARVRKFGMLSDWITTRLTGTFVTEPSAGSSSALFDLRTRDWAHDVIDALELDPDLMPPVVESGEACGQVTAATAARTGLVAGTPVYAGGADTQMALVGLASKPGDATLVAGSFWQMTAISEQPVIDPKRRARSLCHAHPNQWMIEGIGFLTGFSFRWFRDAFCDLELAEAKQCGRSAFELIEEKAAKLPVGVGGLQAIFSTVMQSDSWVHAPASFVGFDPNDPHGKGRIACARALMESGAFVSDCHRQIISECTQQTYDHITMSGGGAAGQLWPQVIADVFNIPVEISTVKETTALGAAILAAMGAGLINDSTDMASGIERAVMPDPSAHNILKEKAQAWAALDQSMLDLGLKGLASPMFHAAGALPRS